MKKSEVYKKAIEAVAKNYFGDTLIEMLRLLMNDLDFAKYCEEEEEKKNG